MKRLLCLFFALLLTITLASCNTKKPDDVSLEFTAEYPEDWESWEEWANNSWVYPTNQPGTAADAPATLEAGTYKVGVCIYKFDDTFMTNYRNEIESYFASLETDDVKFEVTIADGKNDMAEQSIQIDGFIADKVDVLIINLVQASSAGDVTAKAKAAGIPVVYINREPASDDTQAWDYEGKVAYVGTDSRQAGIVQGEIIANLPDKGDIDGDGVVRYVCLLGDAESIAYAPRTYYALKALSSVNIKLNCLLAQRGDWDRAKGQELASNALSQFGDNIDVIFAENDDMALGAIEACRAAGLVIGTDLYIVGIDATDPARDAIADGDLTGTVLNDYVGLSRAAVNAATLAINGDALMRYYILDFLAIT